MSWARLAWLYTILLFVYSSERVVRLCQNTPDLKYELIGSWSVHVGDLDQYVHLWKHRGGYAAIDKTNSVLQHNEVSRHDTNDVFVSILNRVHFIVYHVDIINCLPVFKGIHEIA